MQGGLSYAQLVANKQINQQDLIDYGLKVVNCGYEIISRKHITCYGIGVTLTRIVGAILNDEEILLPISVYLRGQYKQNDIYISLPAILSSKGIKKLVEVELISQEKAQLFKSCQILQEQLKFVQDVIN